METFDTDSKYTMVKIGMNENKAHVDEIHNIRPVHVLSSRFYLDFILTLSTLYSNFIQIFIMFGYNLDIIWIKLERILYLNHVVIFS